MGDKIERKKAQDKKDQGNRRDKKKAEGKRALTVFVKEDVHEALGRLCKGRQQNKEEFLTHLIMECNRIRSCKSFCVNGFFGLLQNRHSAFKYY